MKRIIKDAVYGSAYTASLMLGGAQHEAIVYTDYNVNGALWVCSVYKQPKQSYVVALRITND